MNKIVLDSISINGRIVEYKFHVNEGIAKYFNTDTMFIQYEDDIASVPISILSIPFVNVMAGFSWLSDSMLFIDEIDYTYYESFKKLKSAYEELHRTQFKGLFVPSIITNNSIQSDGVESLLLFGGGVDCHTSFLRNKDSILKIVNIFGWLDDLSEHNIVDESDAEKTLAFAKAMGVDSYHVRSNFASLFDLKLIDKKLCIPRINTSFWYGLLHPMAFLSIASPIAWKFKISNLIIASSFTKDRADVHCGSFITTDTEFRFADSGLTFHDGFELNRQDKVRLLVDYQKVINRYYPLQVCSFNDNNCCICEKCFRTVVALVAENADPRSFGFDRIQGSLKDHWARIVNRDVSMWGVSKESYYYFISKIRMKENYSIMTDENKAFADWFLSFDFEKAKRKALRNYYFTNFFSILKRKFHFAM